MRESVEDKELTLSIEKKALDKIEQERNEKLKKPLFVLNEAKTEFKKIKEKAFTDMINYPSPGFNIKVILEITLILLKRKILVEEYVKGKKVQNYWKSVQEMLKHTMKFRTDILNFEKKSLPIPKETLDQVQDRLSNLKTDKTPLQSSLGAFDSLYSWILAIIDYDKISKDTEKLKNSIDEQTAKVKELVDNYQKAYDELKTEEQKFEEITTRAQQLNASKDELQERIAEVSVKLSHGENLVKWLKPDEKTWSNRIKQLTEEQKKTINDSLLTASYIVYLSPFPGEYRTSLIHNYWKPLLKSTLNYELIKSLHYSSKVMLWHTKGLINNKTFEENAIIMNESDKCPLLIDPQGQGLQFILKKHEGKIIVLKQKNDYLNKLRTVILLSSIRQYLVKFL